MFSSRSKLGLFYGTRPQTVKAARLTEVLGARFDLVTVDTGQHYDYELNGVLYEQLGVRAPDLLLGVGSGSHAEQSAAIITRASGAIERFRPDVVVVVGDTNSTLGCAIAGVQHGLPVVHVEAGLRSGDLRMAEELNRRMVDTVSSLLCAPSESAASQLVLERVPGTVVFTGDVARDVLVRNLPRATAPARIAGWPLGDSEPYAFVTLHRAELTATPATFVGVLDALARLPLPAVLAVHPRTRALIEDEAIDAVGLHLLPALSYFDTLGAIAGSAAVITDSGGVQREAYWMGRPCITVRTETEWTETVALGANTLVAPADAGASLAAAVASALARPTGWDRDAYGTGAAAERIADAIEALARG